MQFLKIKFFKSLYRLQLLIVFILLSNVTFGADFDNNDEGKIKVKINYTENPNQADFFSNNEFEKYNGIGSYEKLDGIWSGNYTLNHESIFWINPSLDNRHIYSTVDFGPYTIGVRFNLIEEVVLSGLEIIQKDVKYSSVNIDLANDKQINYWTKAESKDWFQVIRGKIFRVNENQLFTVFQTTVYENRIPIYAFRGEAVLSKSGKW